MQVCDSPNKIGFNPNRKHFQVEGNEVCKQTSSFTYKWSLRINKFRHYSVIKACVAGVSRRCVVRAMQSGRSTTAGGFDSCTLKIA